MRRQRPDRVVLTSANAALFIARFQAIRAASGGKSIRLLISIFCRNRTGGFQTEEPLAAIDEERPEGK
jgi:hypothetical protein